MLTEIVYSVELSSPITISDFIKPIVRKAGISNIECCAGYGNLSGILYLVMQRVEPLPKNLPDYPELSGLGVKLIMTVEPKINDKERFDRSLNNARMSQNFDEMTYRKQIMYDSFIVKVDREGIDVITQDVTEQINAEL